MNDENKPRHDKRSDRTKALLADTLQSLLERKHFNDIKINDICLEAEVSRAGFYLYFEDKYQLLLYVMHRWGEAVHEMAKPGDIRGLVEVILDMMYTHQKMLNNLLHSERNDEVRDLLFKDLVQAMTVSLEQRQASGMVMEIPIQTLVIFTAAGFTYLINGWVEGSIVATKEELLDQIMKIAEGKAVYDPPLHS